MIRDPGRQPIGGISRLLTAAADRTRAALETTDRQWAAMVRRVASFPEESDRCDDEQLWTFLLAAGYADAGTDGVTALTDALTAGAETAAAGDRIWFEARPIPPRRLEGNTNLDLAVGAIRRRAGTTGGIERDPQGAWVCFVEAKWLSDLSGVVTHDPERNQLARVAENAATFQADATPVERPYATLLTPQRFAPTGSSRLYQHKYRQYTSDPASLAAEVAACPLPVRNDPNFTYPPDGAQRTASVRLTWVHYEDLFDRLEGLGSPLGALVVEFARRFNRTAA